MAARLSDVEVEEALAGLPRWRRDGHHLRRDLVFPSFPEAFGFMAAVALVAERRDHHPEWSNVHRRVSIGLTTHDAGGITALDVALARDIDRLARES